jgi:hypothetical protein
MFSDGLGATAIGWSLEGDLLFLIAETLADTLAKFAQSFRNDISHWNAVKSLRFWC